MMNKRIEARINLRALKHNIKRISESSGSSKIMAVIKADGYGHGSVAIAKALSLEEGVSFFAVATGNEAIELRDAGIKKDILILGAAFPVEYDALIENNIRMCLYTVKEAESLSARASALGKKAYVHLKIDTGMGRLGFPFGESGIEDIKRALSFPGIECEGIFTHFAKADEEDPSFTNLQKERFQDTVDLLSEAGIDFRYKHLANSAAILSGTGGDLVRAGIAMYGLLPGDIFKDAGLIPVMSLYSAVIFVKDIPAGQPVSYGSTFVSDRPMRIATVSAGYGDGYPRRLSGKGWVLIKGHRAPILGRVCMDQFMVDVTDIPEVGFGEEVILVGASGDESITFEDIARISGGFNYELVCDIAKRVPRIYTDLEEK